VNQKAWLLHLTAEKMLRYGYVSREVFNNINTFAVVRNPYSRMVKTRERERRERETRLHERTSGVSLYVQ